MPSIDPFEKRTNRPAVHRARRRKPREKKKYTAILAGISIGLVLLVGLVLIRQGINFGEAPSHSPLPSP